MMGKQHGRVSKQFSWAHWHRCRTKLLVRGAGGRFSRWRPQTVLRRSAAQSPADNRHREQTAWMRAPSCRTQSVGSPSAPAPEFLFPPT